MIAVSKEQKEVLVDYIDNLEELIDAGNIETLLLAIDDAIIFHMGEDDEPDEVGVQLQKIYNQIYEAN